MKYLIATILLLSSFQCIAAIYMQKDSDGDITYSDIPINNAQTVSLSPMNSVPSTNNATPANEKKPTTTTATTTPTNQTTEQTTAAYYNTFTIVSPANNETIQNQPVITVRLATDPALREGDTVQVYLDGQPFGKPVPSVNVNMENVERGEHTIFAKLLDSAQQTLKQTDTVKIFVHRASSNFKAASVGQTRLVDLILS